MPTESLRLAIEIADTAERAAVSDEDLDLKAEARRLGAKHPDAPVTERDIVEVLRDEADHPSAEADPLSY